MGSKFFTRVFVYGTLLRGEPNHCILAEARMLGEARTQSKYDLVDLGAFPAMVEGGQTAIVGEVYAVDSIILQRLDQLEGHPRFYQRKLITLDDGEEVEAYLLTVEQVWGKQRISSGDWRAR